MPSRRNRDRYGANLNNLFHMRNQGAQGEINRTNRLLDAARSNNTLTWPGPRMAGRNTIYNIAREQLIRAYNEEILGNYEPVEPPTELGPEQMRVAIDFDATRATRATSGWYPSSTTLPPPANRDLVDQVMDCFTVRWRQRRSGQFPALWSHQPPDSPYHPGQTTSPTAVSSIRVAELVTYGVMDSLVSAYYLTQRQPPSRVVSVLAQLANEQTQLHVPLEFDRFLGAINSVAIDLLRAMPDDPPSSDEEQRRVMATRAYMTHMLWAVHLATTGATPTARFQEPTNVLGRGRITAFLPLLLGAPPPSGSIVMERYELWHFFVAPYDYLNFLFRGSPQPDPQVTERNLIAAFSSLSDSELETLLRIERGDLAWLRWAECPGNSNRWLSEFPPPAVANLEELVRMAQAARRFGMSAEELAASFQAFAPVSLHPSAPWGRLKFRQGNFLVVNRELVRHRSFALGVETNPGDLLSRQLRPRGTSLGRYDLLYEHPKENS